MTELALTVVQAAKPGPVVLIRTPYGRQNHLAEAEGWARRGFSCVVGDVRGRFESTGDFRPYVHERSDGATVVDWIVRQQFYDGGVLLVGGSYAAYCAITAALARPEVAIGVIAAVPALGQGETVREPGGAARLECRVGWWSEHGDTRIPRPAASFQHLLTQKPIRDIHSDLAGWNEVWAAPRRAPELWDEIGKARMPLLAVGGLADPFAADTIELARSWGASARLLLGPWGHELGRGIGRVYVDWARALGRLTGYKELISVADGEWRAIAPVRTRIEMTVEQGDFVADPDCPYPTHRSGSFAVLKAVVPQGEIRGQFAVELCAHADCADADWVVHAWLDDVYLGHGIRRVCGSRKFIVDCTPAGVIVAKRAELRIEVAGHNWPRHARNPHTGEDPFTADTLLPSKRIVLAATAVLAWAAGDTGRARVEEITA
ncbi:CocE/NonD family hydrolase [Kibdelosporangium philippinense]|uniref:CocE/NonD family hydrolase n=1 Tax=Kibdelosporangium philippinense TaxID=211113 RepID=A0ABS8Z5E5_9PSEU|nr:CocE/NonD family hydrolase [Kibdelosporangium philippinense]MCE7001975.1 CocE/NonD family hydrolase [Kibdelosporangium philippinense]